MRPAGGYGNTKKAFTLIELLVVIAIIAILARYFFLSLAGHARTRAAVVVRARQAIGLGMAQYTQDYDERFLRQSLALPEGLHFAISCSLI
jgi:prepilin-type N-terminal cleavage/methylation domain-containing protein